MSALSAERWTVVALRVRRGETDGWDWIQGFNSDALQDDAAKGRIILMHRRTPRGVELVARIAGPEWRRMQERAA